MSEQHPFEESQGVEEESVQSVASESSQESTAVPSPATGFPHIAVAAPEFVAKTEDLESSSSQTVDQAPSVAAAETSSMAQAPVSPAQAPQSQPVSQADVEHQHGFPSLKQPAQDNTKLSIFLVIGILIGLVIGGVSGYLIGTAVPRPYQTEQSALQTSEDLDDLVSSDGDSDFTWELSDIDNLVFLTSYDQGESPWETTETYGKANSSNDSDDELSLTWYEPASYRSVRAGYEELNGRYQLKSFTADFLPGGNWKEDPKEVSKDFLKNLKVGDSETGKGGASYKEVIKQYGDVQRLQIFSTDYAEAAKLTLDYNLDDGDYAELTFVRQSNGDYLLSDTFTY